jgi:ATP-binding cassette subfamily B protein
VPDIKIVHELCREEFAAEVDGKKDLNRFSDKITFENVWFKYGSMDDYLLKNLSFSLERRRKTAIVGLSGAGKTTIINLLLKLYRPDKGAIKIDEEDILELSNKTYLSIIGYVSQETFIFNASFKENIKFGMENCTDEMIEEAARLANAHDFIVGTQQGYDTVVGDSGVKLSGGQRQRVAIARAMLRNPEIIVLDEATSSLDNISEKKIQKAINNISKHTTVLVIAHRLSTVQNADKIIILERGEIREQGTHEELLKNKKLYYDLHMSKDSVDDELAEEKIG